MCTEERRMGMVMSDAKAGADASEVMMEMDATEAAAEKSVPAADPKVEMSDETQCDFSAQQDEESEIPEEDPNVLMFEVRDIRHICPVIRSMGRHVAEIFENQIDADAFYRDEDDFIVDLINRLYRAGACYEVIELLELAFTFIECEEPAELLRVTAETEDEDSYRDFVEAFILTLNRNDLQKLQRTIDPTRC